MYFLTKNRNEGFTLIELLLVISIVGMLAALLLGYMEDSRASARDANRKQQLRSMQTVIEFYRNETGSYPQTAVNEWVHSCANNSAYIPNLIAEGYASQLPNEPASCLTGPFDGYWYSSNGDDFKLLYYSPHDLPAAGEIFYDGNRANPTGPKAFAVCSDEALCVDETAFTGFGSAPN